MLTPHMVLQMNVEHHAGFVGKLDTKLWTAFIR
jgi:hypothetical protein